MKIVSVTLDSYHVHSLARVLPTRALNELVWNALDTYDARADAG